MTQVARSRSWRDELASLVEDTGIRYTANGIDVADPGEKKPEDFGGGFGGNDVVQAEESFKDQMKGFLKASTEMLLELGRGCRDIAIQSLGNEDSFIVRKLGRPCKVVSSRLRFLNEYLPEDRDPAHAWPVVVFVFFLAFAVLTVNTNPQSSVPPPKKLYISPPSATRVQLPDGRYIAYQEQGVSADRARFSLVAPHSFLSSRLAGIPGIKTSLLEEYGAHLVTYDLPGFGESDPHPQRNLNSSALDMSYIANALGVVGKFWVVGYSGGGMHAWAAVRYIPDRLAGVAMFAPMSNPYDSSMTNEEKYKIWQRWSTRRKLMYFLARRFPSFLSYFYHRSFLSGQHGQLDKWLSVSLGKKDRALMEELDFNEFWERDVAESVRQGNSKPFIEEAVLQVSHWGFSLADLQVQRKHQLKGFLPWLKSIYSQAEREEAGFPGPIHIWQGTDDWVVPPSMTDFVRRVVPRATVHSLHGEGHFSYFCFCDDCHGQIFATLFGDPQGPVIVAEDQPSLSPDESNEMSFTDVDQD